MTTNGTNDSILSVRALKTYFYTDAGVAKAVDDVSFDIPAGKTLALVGESGCGKSMSALSILRLIPTPPGRIVDGEILFKGRNLLKVPEREMRRIRGNDISMIFQEPMTSLNPVFRVGKQIMAAMMLHRHISEEKARQQTIELLAQVGIPAPDERVDDYPHQMSGGMRQRVMIAMALACDPVLLIADEPTTALDVTIQAQILDLLRELQASTGMAILLITHDLGVVAEMADRVAIMYAGEIVEEAPVRAIFGAPQHPYTLGLFKSLPSIAGVGGRLASIKGTVPSAVHFPTGCRFHTRCPFAEPQCGQAPPTLVSAGGDHRVACWLHDPAYMASTHRPVGVPNAEEAFL